MARTIQSPSAPQRTLWVHYAPADVNRALTAAGFYDPGILPAIRYDRYTEQAGQYGTLLRASCLAMLDAARAALAAAALSEPDDVAVAEQERRNRLPWDEAIAEGQARLDARAGD